MKKQDGTGGAEETETSAEAKDWAKLLPAAEEEEAAAGKQGREARNTGVSKQGEVHLFMQTRCKPAG